MKYMAIIDADEKPVSCEFIGCNGNVAPYLIGATTNIKALEQQPSEDCVRRQAVDQLCYRFLSHSAHNIAFYEHFCNLPSVTPTRKVGKWIGEKEGYYSECSCCGASFLWEDYKCIGDWKYCPKCGAEITKE